MTTERSIQPTNQNSSQLLIYQSEEDVTRLEVQDETVWLNQRHMAEPFQTTVPKH